MGSWWRSEEMTYVSLILSEEAAPACVRELGVMGCVQFTDLNPDLTPFQRRYVSYIKRCDELERKIRYVSGEVKRLGVPIQPSASSVDSFIEQTAQQGGTQVAMSGSSSIKALTPQSITALSGVILLEALETKLESYEQQLLELNKYSVKLSEEYTHKVEYHHLLVKSRKFLGEATNLERQEAAGGIDSDGDGDLNEIGFAMTPLVGATRDSSGAADSDMSFSNIAGVVPTADKARFERMLYRSTRGNCYVRFSSLSSKARDANGQQIDKICFIIFYKSASIEAKIKRICDAFSANRYDLSNLNRTFELQGQQQRNQREMQDAKVVLDKNTETRLRLCVEASSCLEEWLWLVRREKGVYHTLNLFKNDVASNLLRGRGWILSASVPAARTALKRAHIQMNLVPTAMLERVPTAWPTAPTHFTTNKYTWAFQEFVNTYGVPRYREANPALFTAATFPFFFGVMYGDVGHGSILSMGGLYLILTESKGSARGVDEMVSGIYSARYMLFGMGIMAVYAGLVYNDYFSLGLNLFGSSYVYESEEDGASATLIGKYGDSQIVYPFGVDPAWKISGNELLFYNSMKMKMSVVLGIFQMTFGIILRGINSYYFRSYLDFFTEFMPMIIFDLALFGYMVILIFLKWSINWQDRMALGSCNYNKAGEFGACNLGTSTSCYTVSGNYCDTNTLLFEKCPLNYGGTSNGCQPPNLITTLINIALKPGVVDEPMYEGQAGVQTFLLLVAFLCVPWLLMVKPLYLKYTHKPPVVAGATSAENPLLGGSSVGHSNPHGTHGADENDEDGGHGGGGGGHGGHGHDGEFNFGEIFIHQAIETIEFVLGMVSNTASYLRLWALSLAHTELATVFWEKAMVAAIDMNNPVLIFFGYAVFAAVTFGVLLAMDVLECFLHALRLHWVEFQNKFFKADGYRFAPFDFRAIIDKAVLE